ncbi:hypothetical protein [Pseudomonas syringae]|uniref:hypothetical protein n=1 Tax=Pseudomonas syringae TaxID=317 RepID=UPI00200ABEB8|nr:hypothetical protein [Pseudomonas syringae]MCK9738073.1 hypothetical protein [Pseudomonas syringae pv. syringae]
MKDISSYKVLTWSRLMGQVALIMILYCAFTWFFGDQLKGLLPDALIKTLKFTAFLLASYPMWQSIGLGKHKETMLKNATLGQASSKEKRHAINQLKLIATDEERGILLAHISFVVLAILAFIGEI